MTVFVSQNKVAFEEAGNGGSKEFASTCNRQFNFRSGRILQQFILLYFLLLLLSTVIITPVHGQMAVPFISNVERLMVFGEKRFKEVDVRPPQRFWPMDRALFFQDHSGQLVYYSVDGGQARIVEPHEPDTIQVAGDRVAWLRGDTLKTLRSGRAHVLATAVPRFTVTDSLIVYHDSLEHELMVVWRGQRLPLAKLEQASQRPQWTQGGNTVTFYDRSARSLYLFRNGILKVLSDSSDVGIAVNGTDVVGYWNDVRDEFIGDLNGKVERLAGLKPVSAQAGDGVLAFVDGTLKLKYWAGSAVITLTDTMPTKYWVKDKVLLYLDGGLLKMVGSGSDVPLTVADVLPEKWQVSGDLLVYLDENRELRGLRNGKRIKFGSEAAIANFELYGDAVVYKSPTGPITVVRQGKSYLY